MVNYKCETVYVLICQRITAKLFMKFVCCKRQHSAWKWVLLKFLCSSHWRIFHSYGDLTIAGEGMQALTYARHFWPFFSVPYQLWHGESVYNGHFRGPVTQLLPIVWWRSSHYLFLPMSWLGFEHPTFRMRGERSNELWHRHGPWKIKRNVLILILISRFSRNLKHLNSSIF